MFPITSSAIYGVRAISVSIETDISSGLPNFTIVGLPDTSVKESRDRIRAAIKNNGFAFPRGHVTVNLAPAHLRKLGAVYDLAIAVSILERTGEIIQPTLEHSVILGELGLNGEVRAVSGVLPTAIMAKAVNKPLLFVPKDNAREAALISGLSVFGVNSLKEITDHLREQEFIEQTTQQTPVEQKQNNNCFSYIRGQAFAKRGLEIAAAGGHNVLLQGPPGTGKTMLAKAFPSILPALSYEEAIEVASIASITGIKDKQTDISFERPFRNPHHSCSAVALIGGGPWPTPGEVSLAHRGVLFLDELPEFSHHALESMRQPLEDGVVTVARAVGSFTFPARFQMIATRNPCPCGFINDQKHACQCSIGEINKYQKRISGPLLDRIDMVIDVPNIEVKDLSGAGDGETSFVVAERVAKARAIQTERFKDLSIHLNSEMQTREINKLANVSKKAKTLINRAFENGMISARGYFRIQKMARTVADLAESTTVEEAHAAEAMQYQSRKT